MSQLHSYLISMQSIKELTRKANKSKRRGHTSTEEIDLMACTTAKALQPLFEFDKKLSKDMEEAFSKLNK